MAGVRTSVGVKTVTGELAEKLAGGAALRAAGPLMGRAVGFIVATAAGVGIDIALRKLDELLNRDELEQAWTVLVDEEKERVKAALESAVDEVKVMALGTLSRRSCGRERSPREVRLRVAHRSP